MDKVLSCFSSILDFLLEAFPIIMICILCIVLIITIIVYSIQPKMVYDVDVNGVLYEKVSFDFSLSKKSVRLDYEDGNWVRINNVERFEVLAEYRVDELEKGGEEDDG